MRRCLLCLLFILLLPSARAQFMTGMAGVGAAGLRPSQVAVVVNEAFPGSVEVGEYYLRARGVPPQNLIKLNFPAESTTLKAAEFEKIRQAINAQLSSSIEVVLFVWTKPYRAECNALTGAYSLGLQTELCAKTCGPSRHSPYFDSTAASPRREAGLRLSMLLPVESVEQAKALIDRGVAADGRWPRAKAFFLKTSDANRSSRAMFFPRSAQWFSPALSINTLNADRIDNESEILIYETGLAQVPGLETLRFVPGAVADHLTSVGGDLLGSAQMSALRWLEAGATGSYGTVTEPCNFWQKFPNPAVLLKHYLAGSTLVEAYWRSVAWPGQGLFIGEPLAAPYRKPNP